MIKPRIMIIKRMDAAHSASQLRNNAKTNCSQPRAFRKIRTMPTNIKTMKNFVQVGNFSKVNSLSLKKTPTSKRKETPRISRRTMLAITSLMMATSCVEAITRKAIEKATIALIFFLVIYKLRDRLLT